MCFLFSCELKITLIDIKEKRLHPLQGTTLKLSASKSSSLWICYFTWQRSIKAAAEINVAHQLPLR